MNPQSRIYDLWTVLNIAKIGKFYLHSKGFQRSESELSTDVLHEGQAGNISILVIETFLTSAALIINNSIAKSANFVNY